MRALSHYTILEVMKKSNINFICLLVKNTIIENKYRNTIYVSYTFEKHSPQTYSLRSRFPRRITTCFSHPQFIPDPTRRKQDRKIPVDRVILLTLRLARAFSLPVDALDTWCRKIFDFECLYVLLFIFHEIDWHVNLRERSWIKKKCLLIVSFIFLCWYFRDFYLFFRRNFQTLRKY